MSGVSSNAHRLAENWAKRAKLLGPKMREATTEATRLLLAESKKEMNTLIYDKPVPTKAQVAQEKGKLGKNGRIGVSFNAKSGGKTKSVNFETSKRYSKKPAWKRTGNLKRSEKMRVVSDFVGIVENAASKRGKGYAAARHNMTKTRFPASWRAKAIATCKPKIRLIYRAKLREAIMAGLISGPGGF